ncbi:hypothetical protein [Streptomyces bluensis]|uniref:hypothetical protein n=1 Tax=Streptomyces bluensis TaxID=33897 RepID=UPI001675292E|nr:hypothetical protein [Streptomyces bluensis]GGZ54195.1 hypothetical protein GCM10010344_20460 [Streptomyces bluensis]
MTTSPNIARLDAGPPGRLVRWRPVVPEGSGVSGVSGVSGISGISGISGERAA